MDEQVAQPGGIRAEQCLDPAGNPRWSATPSAPASTGWGGRSGAPREQLSLTIPGDTTVFGYDAMGNLRRADNRYAKVRRGYYANGLLRGDTIKVQTLAVDDTTKHVYALGHTYDLNGRRTGMQHPAALAPVNNAVTRYAYDPVTGALEGVTDPLSNAFGFTYD